MEYLSYIEAKQVIKSRGIDTLPKWVKFHYSSEYPKSFPKEPRVYYKQTGEWKGWDDFLGGHDFKKPENKHIKALQ